MAEAERGGSPPASVVDLGSGAGVPGLVLAVRWAGASFLLVDAHQRRAAFLAGAIRQLDVSGRVVAVAERAERLGRTPHVRGRYDLVTARGFGRPAVVAECAAPLLRTGGLLVVSEPPPAGTADHARWPAERLAELGMGPALAAGSSYRFAAIGQERMCPDRFPRRVGVPSKRPLF